eukprot:TRINITY_DN17815_c0_g1_i2.p1 TRINITY_DN17815_c0_g1~~TRINITY_DN17815_c0_g1_i2.p1  ORF type:complete len:120 (+),score=18.55 TRINITY_DN17815_c0_g1_i2:302-661(+)
MIPQAEGREILYAMLKNSVIRSQQLARSSDGAVAQSYWLYYIDHKHLMKTLHDNAMQAMLNIRVRFRKESALVVPLESRANSLTAKERIALRDGRRKEDILERAFLVLDAVPMVLRSLR